METKNIIIIGVLVVIICVLAGAIFGTLTNSVNYERIEIVPNGTSIEVPTENAKYEGEMNETGAKLWTFKQGSLVTFNSEEAVNSRGLYGLGGAVGIKTINDMVLNHFEKREEIDGFTVYTLDANKLGIENRSTMYCIIVGNDTTHDNIVITVDNIDIALHMAKSIQYKTSNSTTNNVNAATSSSGNSSDLVPVTMDDGSVIYRHVGDYIEKQDGIYRVNSDGSVTKIADSSDSQIDDNHNDDASSDKSSSGSSSKDSSSDSSYPEPTPSGDDSGGSSSSDSSSSDSGSDGGGSE